MADKSKGLITLLRDIQGHWLWRHKPFSKGQAWIDMILSANHKDAMVPLESGIILVKRGEFITSQFKLAERWGWGRQQVRGFLKTLSNSHSKYSHGNRSGTDREMVACQNLTKKATKITILNYNDLQKLPTKKATIWQPTGNQLATINKNDKNDKNEKNKDIIASQDFITTLKNNPAYKGIDIDRELAKMDAWFLIRPKRKKTKRFILNWLNRIDQPIDQPKDTITIKRSLND